MHEHCNSYCNTIYLNVFEMSNFLANTMKQMCFKQTLEIKKRWRASVIFCMILNKIPRKSFVVFYAQFIYNR